jgi:hypothetical protein
MRTDIDSIVREVEANGVCVVPDFIPRDLLAHIKEHVDRLNVAERESGRGFIESEVLSGADGYVGSPIRAFLFRHSRARLLVEESLRSDCPLHVRATCR